MIYDKNINLFNEIDTEEKAYWLGILMADGAIAEGKNNKTPYYGIKFGLCDIDIMNKYKKFFDIPEDFPYQILYQENCQPVYYIYITCHKIAEDLVKHGMVPNKDYRTKIPKMPKNLIRHFIRGYFDGDGCIYVRDKTLKDGTLKKEKFIAITSCSTTILKQIEEILKNLNLIRKNKNHVKFPKIYKNKKHPPFLGLSHRADIYQFFHFIYDGATIYMDRKFNLYNSIKDEFAPPQGKKGKKKYYGIYFIKKNKNRPYFVSFQFNNIKYSVGYYKTQNEAILSYNTKIKELGLPDFMLNKIEN